MNLQLSNNSAIEIIPFETYDELAVLTAPFASHGSIGLSGGTIFGKLFDAWAHLPVFGKNATFFPVDERIVPLDNSASNWGAACRKLFAPHNMQGQCNNSATSAAAYRDLLMSHFGDSPFIFNTIFLGVGDDGHTASLFPGDSLVNKRDLQVFATESPKGIKERITLSSDVLINAQKCIVILAGENKEACLIWLLNKDTRRPFVKILTERETSTLYMHQPLYEFLQKNC